METNKRKLIKQCTNLLARELAQQLIELLEQDLAELVDIPTVTQTKKKLMKPPKKKRVWVKNATNHKDSTGLPLEVFPNDPSLSFLKSVGIGQEEFTWLLHRVSPFIQKQDTLMRDALPAHIKLKTVLGYLVMGGSYQYLSDQFQVPRNSISSFLSDVMSAICYALEDFIKVPSTNEEWQPIEKEFYKKYGFPNCYGSLDGKCIQILSKRPLTILKHKVQHCNVVMMALVDADNCFSYVGVETTIQNNFDKQNFDETSLCKALDKNDFNLPGNSVIVANGSFPLKDNIMIPYLDSKTLSNEKYVYNNHILRVVRVSDNALKILCTKFHVFSKTINVGLDKIPVLVKSCCSLHNWLKKTNPAYLDPEFLEMDAYNDLGLESWNEEHSVGGALQNIGTFASLESTTAIAKQKWFVNYFNRRNKLPEMRNENT